MLKLAAAAQQDVVGYERSSAILIDHGRSFGWRGATLFARKKRVLTHSRSALFWSCNGFMGINVENEMKSNRNRGADCDRGAPG